MNINLHFNNFAHFLTYSGTKFFIIPFHFKQKM